MIDQIRNALQTNLPIFYIKGARIICIAIAFEIALWALNRFLEKQTAPMLNADANREVAWKSRRDARPAICKACKLISIRSVPTLMPAARSTRAKCITLSAR